MIDINRRWIYAGVTLAIVCAGLLCRWPALGLPWPIAKYAGSVLWGAMVYAALRTISPRATVLGAVFVAMTIAVGVEVFRLYHQPQLDLFRTTLAGRLLLGRVFSIWNIAAYAAGIAGCAYLDTRITRDDPLASSLTSPP